MYAWFVRHCSLPLYQKWHGSKLLKLVREFERSARFSQDELRSIQWARLQRMIRHAYDHVPYYRNLFDDQQVVPEDIRSFEDFGTLPTLRKEALQDQLDDLLAANVPKEQRHRGITSGSSGRPTYYVQDIPGNQVRAAAGRRLLRMTGYDFGLRVFYFWRRSPYTVGADTVTRSEALEATAAPPFPVRIKHWAYRHFAANNPAYHEDPTLLTESEMANTYRALKRFRPHVIVAYVNALYRLAQFLDAEGLANTIRPRSVVVSSETLYPHQKALMGRVFGCRVFNRYGLQETGMVAVECPEGEGLHTNTEILHLEYVPVSGGEKQIVVTDLINRAMPLLRYETGDTGEPISGQCACGRGLSRIGSLQGRVIELLPTRSGGLVNGQLFATFHSIPGVKQYQVVQEALDAFVLRIVRGQGYMEESLHPMIETIWERFGADTRVDIEYPDSIPFTGGGKYKLVVSAVTASTRNDVGGTAA